MPKPTTGSRSARTQLGGVVRGRDAEFPSAPVRVSGDAQAKAIDFNTPRQIEFTRLERNKLPDRPSTSGGPAANLSIQRNAEKRETKDDLHVNPLTAHGTGTTFYNFPLPSALPTPSSTPVSSPPLRKSSLPHSYTPNSMEFGSANLVVPPMEIGMALGSPSHQPEPLHSHSAIDTEGNVSPDPVDSSVDTGAYVAASSKQKTSKWKIFGGLFGGKKQAGGPSQTFYQLQPENITFQTAVEFDPIHSGEQPSSSEPKTHRGRRRTNSQRNPDKHKPDMKRANTAPLNFDFEDTKLRNQIAPPEIKLDGGPLMPQSSQRQRRPGGPLLNVDIPSVEMERYSIMFGSLLQKPAGTSSSLLARRQATLNRLKSVNEALVEKERELEERSKRLRARRATSPQPTKSPAFSLFPNTPSRLTVRDGSPSPNRHTLQRSNTSPAALSPSFPPGPQNETHATLMAPGPHVPMIPQPRDENPSQNKREPKSPLQKSDYPSRPQRSRNWLPEESHLALDSPSSDTAEEDDVYDLAPFVMKPKLEEPTWQMIVPQPAALGSSSITSSSAHSTSTSASSISTTSIAPFASSTSNNVKIQPPPFKFRSRSGTAPSSTHIHRTPPKTSTSSSATSTQQRPEISKASSTTRIPQSPEGLSVSSPKVQNPTGTEVDEENEARLKTAADISIARQISVSRQQRQLLIPIRATSKINPKSKYNQNFPSPLNMNRGASPLAVVAAESPPSGPSSGRKGSVNGAVNERLVAASVKPSTPTLVVVGDGNGEKWRGRAVENPISSGSGETRDGLAVGLEAHGHHHRKSERVVVENVSAISN